MATAQRVRLPVLVEWAQSCCRKKGQRSRFQVPEFFLTWSLSGLLNAFWSLVILLVADPTHEIPGQNNDQMDTDTFLMMGFLILPLLFVMFSMFQRMGRRRPELPQGKASRDGPNRDDGPPTPPVD